MKFEMSESPTLHDYMGDMNIPSVGSSEKSRSPPNLPPHVKKSAFFTIDQILGKRDQQIEDEVFTEEDRTSDDAEDIDVDVNISDDADEGDKAEMRADRLDKDGVADSKSDKQTPSYTAIIAQAILSSSEKKLPLGCIYDYIAEHFPQFLKKGQGWRNCVRHNLSLSECFVKAGRARNGRGNYWGIHPRYIKNFSKGDFRKRRASHRPRNRELGYLTGRFFPHYYNPYALSTAFPKHPIPQPQRTFTVDSILRSESVDQGPPTLISSYKPVLRFTPQDDRISKYTTYSQKYNMLTPPPSLTTLTHASDYYSTHVCPSPNQKGYDYRAKVACSCHHLCCQPART